MKKWLIWLSLIALLWGVAYKNKDKIVEKINSCPILKDKKDKLEAYLPVYKYKAKKMFEKFKNDMLK